LACWQFWIDGGGIFNSIVTWRYRIKKLGIE